jgi:hypothetical protein
MNVPAPQPTAQSPNARLKMQLGVLHLCSSGIRAPAPTAAAQSDLLLLHYCMLLHPMCSYSHVPTAAHPLAQLQQLQHKSLHPTDTRSPWPTVEVAKGALLQLHM